MQPVRSIRFRITAIAAFAVLVVLIVGGAALVLLQRTALTANVDQALTQRSDDIVALVEAGAVPDTLPGAGEGFAQLVGSNGTVIAASPRRRCSNSTNRAGSLSAPSSLPTLKRDLAGLLLSAAWWCSL